MDTNGHELFFGDEVRQIVGCAFEVLKCLGSGLLEKPYENALCVEFKMRGIPFRQQPRYQVIYKGIKVGDYIPDLIAFDNIIIDTKTVDRITNMKVSR